MVVSTGVVGVVQCIVHVHVQYVIAIFCLHTTLKLLLKQVLTIGVAVVGIALKAGSFFFGTGQYWITNW